MSRKIRQRWSYVQLFIVAVLLYSLTAQIGVQAADSGEFQVVAWTFGIAHPPGYPLFTLISGVFAHLPFGNPYAQMTLVSVLAAAATLVLVAAAANTIAQPKTSTRFSLIGIIPALALATSSTFWAQATTTNIRSLTSFFMALMLWAVLQNGRRGLFTFCLAFGLGVGHHLSLLFPGAVLAVYAFANYCQHSKAATPPLLHHSKELASTIIIGLFIIVASQFVWLYLPIRDAAGARFAPGNLNTLENVLYHIRGGGFEGDMLYFVRKEPQLLWDRLALLPQLMTFQFGPVLPWLMGLSALVLLFRRTTLSLTLLIAFALHMFITLTYRAPQTVEYALPAWIIACVMLTQIKNLAWKIKNLGKKIIRNATFFILNFQFLAVLILVAINFGQRLPSFVALANDDSVRDAAQRTLENAAPNATIFARWHQATPMWARQDIDGFRRDVTVAYVDPRGGDDYATQFARRIAQSTAPARYSSSYNAAAFAEARLCAIPQQAMPVWEVLPCPIKSSKPAAPLLFDGRIEVFSVKPDREIMTQGGRLEVIVIWRAAAPIVDGDSISIRLIYPDGRLASNADVRLDSQQQVGEVQSRRIGLGVPLDLPLGEQPILLGAYRGGQIFKAAVGGEFVPAAAVHNQTGITSSTTALRYADQMQLLGASTQRRGDELVIDLDWLALQALTTDYIVSVRIEGDGFFNSHDAVPALGAIPTLKWLAGVRVIDRHIIPLNGYRGTLRASVVVYDSTSGLPLPIVNRPAQDSGQWSVVSE